MKSFVKLLGLFMLVFVGCTDDVAFDNSGIQGPLKSKGVSPTQEPKTVTVPMKTDFASTPNTPDLVPCLPEGCNIFLPEAGLIRGNATHLGRIQEAQSTYEITGCNFDPALNQLTTYFNGKITAANGDYYNYTGTIITHIPDGNFTGDIVVNGGTGRFDGATGSIPIIGTADFNTGALSWTGEGTLTFVTGNNK